MDKDSIISSYSAKLVENRQRCKKFPANALRRRTLLGLLALALLFVAPPAAAQETFEFEGPPAKLSTWDAVEVTFHFPLSASGNEYGQYCYNGACERISTGFSSTNLNRPWAIYRMTPSRNPSRWEGGKSGSEPFTMGINFEFRDISGKWSVNVDPDPPTVMIDGPTAPQNGPFDVTFRVSERVTTFDQGDIVVGNGSVTAFSGQGESPHATYTARITPAASGPVTVDVPAGRFEDRLVNWPNLAAAQYTVDADLETPTVSIDGVPDKISDQTPGPLTVRFEFSEDVTGFDAAEDVTVDHGDLGPLTGGGRSYSAPVTPTCDGNLKVTVAARAAQDAAGNAGPPVAVSASGDVLCGTEPADSDEDPELEVTQLVITNPGAKTYEQGETIAPFAIEVTDAQPNLTVGVAGLPDGLAYNADAGKVSGTVATDAVVKDYPVTITARDLWNGAAPVTFTVTVTVPGDADDFTLTREIAENSPADTTVGLPVAATDPDGDPLTYRLSGSNAFVIDSATGQIKVATGQTLNYKAKSSYAATVTVTDGYGGGLIIPVTIDLTDVDEPPTKPNAPTVTPSSTDPRTRLDVGWTAPANTGPPITDYDVQYRVKDSGGAFTDPGYDGTGTSTTIGSLTVDTEYEVQVRASNDEGTGPWSDSGTGSTRTYQTSPTNEENPKITRKIAENSPAGSTVGDPVAAIEPEIDPSLTYALSGSAAFVIDTTTAQIRVANGAVLDYETTPSYTLTMTLTNGKNAFGNPDPSIDETVEVTIKVIDVDEPPGRPDAPTVTTSSTDPDTALDVSWTAPANTGPPITGYAMQYRVEGASSWTSHTVNGTYIQTTIDGLEEGTTYQVQVRASNAEGAGPWSEPGTGSTEAVNSPPSFNDPHNPDTPLTTATQSVAENVPAGTHVGDPLTATDPEGDPLSYALSGSNAFVIDSATGQIKVAPDQTLNYEALSDYLVIVSVTDGQDADGNADSAIDATIEVTINLTDVDEPPAKPDALTVTVSSTDPHTTLDVGWTAPENTGPPITDYDVQYRVEGASSWTSHTVNGTDTQTTIDGLEEGTTYEVQVRAGNDEGTGPWSEPGTGLTYPVATEQNAPTLTIAGVPETISSLDPLTVTFHFSEAVIGFEETDIEVENGTLGTLTGSGASYSALVTPDGGGDLKITVVAHAAHVWAPVAFSQRQGPPAAAAQGTAPVALRQRRGPRAAAAQDTEDNTGPAEPVSATARLITLADGDDPPGRPDAPTVKGASSTSVRVSWTAPANAGPPIIDYDVQYRVADRGGAFIDPDYDGTGTSTTLGSLSADTEYEVQVRTGNAEGTGPWSESGRGRTRGNRPPTFDPPDSGPDDALTRTVAGNPAGGAVTRTFPENSPEGTAIGDPVTATDADGDPLSYTLSGTDAGSFAIDGDSGQLRTKAGVSYDYEVRSSYGVRVVATDDDGESANMKVSIAVADVDEPPGRPDAPTVTGASRTSVTVSWTSPTNEGGSAITDYDVQYRIADHGGAFTDAGYEGTDTKTTLGSLRANTEYEVQVRASNNEGTSPWSEPGRGAPLLDLTVSFAQAAYTIAEGGERASIDVNLSPAADRQVEVPLEVKLLAGTTDADYDGVPESVVFEVGATSVRFPVAALADEENDPNEGIVLGFGDLPEMVIAGDPAATRVNFTQQRSAEQFSRSLQVMLAVAARSVAESATTAIESRFARKRQRMRTSKSGKRGSQAGPGAGGTVAGPRAAPSAAEAAPRAVSEVETPATTPTAPHVPGDAIEKVTLARDQGKLRVLITANGPIEHRSFRLRNPPRLVVDIPQTVYREGHRNLRVEIPPLQSVRVAQFRRHPPVTRVVLDLDRMTPYQVRRRGPVVEVELGAPEAETPATTPPARPETGSPTAAIADDHPSRAAGDDRAGADRFGSARPTRPTGGIDSSLNLVSSGSGRWSFQGLGSLVQTRTGLTSGYGLTPTPAAYGHDPRPSGSFAANPSLGAHPSPEMNMLDRFLPQASFNLHLGESARSTDTGSEGMVLWGQGDLQYFNGNLTQVGMNYRGNLKAAHVGMDLYNSERMLVGFSFMRSWADMNYSDDGIDGLLGSGLNTAHPYLYWQPSERFSAWVIAGLGRGQVAVNEPGRTHQFNGTFQMLAGGMRSMLARRGNTELGVVVDSFTARLGTNTSEDLARVRGHVSRTRMMLEMVHDKPLAAGRSLSLKAEFGSRHDEGDADRGSGAEAGFRLGFLDAGSGLDIAWHGRLLLVHESDYRDFSVGMQVSWDPGKKERGLQLSMMSARGRDGGGRTTLWNNNSALLNGPLGGGYMAHASRTRTDSEVAYGLDVFGGRGLLTPYSRVQMAGPGRALYMGTELSLPSRWLQAMAAKFALEAMRRETVSGMIDLGARLVISIPF